MILLGGILDRAAMVLAMASALSTHAAIASTAREPGALRIVERTVLARSNISRVQFEEELPGTVEGGEEARSVGGTVVIDCAVRRLQIEHYSIHVEPHLKGRTIVDVGKQANWRTPSADTTFGRLLSEACSDRPLARLRSPDRTAPSTVGSPGSASRANTVGAPPGPHPQASERTSVDPPVASPAKLADRPRDAASPILTALEAHLARPSPSRSDAALETAGIAGEKPTEVAESGPVGTASDQPSEPPAVAALPAKAIEAAAPSPQSASGPSPPQSSPPPMAIAAQGHGPNDTPGDQQTYFVQVAAEKSADRANAVLADMIAHAQAETPAIKGQVLRARVHDARFFRVMLGPLPRRDLAEGLCRALARASPGCFLRPVDVHRPDE